MDLRRLVFYKRSFLLFQVLKATEEKKENQKERENIINPRKKDRIK